MIIVFFLLICKRIDRRTALNILRPGSMPPPPQSLQSSGLTLSETSMGRCVCKVNVSAAACFVFYYFIIEIIYSFEQSAWISSEKACFNCSLTPQLIFRAFKCVFSVGQISSFCSQRRTKTLVASPDRVFFFFSWSRPQRVTAGAATLSNHSSLDGCDCLTRIFGRMLGCYQENQWNKIV